MHSGAGDAPQRAPGSPIRTPPDQRSVDSSPGPIAASHVLHRLLVPRHPPCALNHLHTTHTRRPPHRAHAADPTRDNVRHHQGTTTETRPYKDLEIYTKTTTTPSPTPPARRQEQSETRQPSSLDARIHYPVHKHPAATQTPTPPPDAPHTRNPPPPTRHNNSTPTRNTRPRHTRPV
jgi:hypothetical protein